MLAEHFRISVKREPGAPPGLIFNHLHDLPVDEADFYFCGPKPFLFTIYQQLRERGGAEDRLHLEFFGPMEDVRKPAGSASAG